ncbi:hypothetical protein [Pseudoxanthomonas mexicana]
MTPVVALPVPPRAPRGLAVLARWRMAEVQQRLRRARWIAAERLSAQEAAYIPLDFDPEARR